MNFFAFSALVNLFASLILAVLVYRKNKVSPVNRVFSYFALSVAFWSFGYYFWQVADNAFAALFWSRVLMAGAIFIPVTYFHFCLALVEKLSKFKKFLVASYALFGAFFLLNLTPYFVARVEPLYWFEYWPRPGLAYHLFLLLWVVYVTYATYLLYQKYRNTVGIQKTQIKYVFFGMVIGFVGGSTNYFLWYGIPIPPVGNILVSVYVGAIAYAIIRYRLMDVRLVVKRIFIYLLVASFTYGCFYLVAWIYQSYTGGVFSRTGYITGIFIAPLFVSAIFGVDRLVKKIANKFFFFSLYNYQEAIGKLSGELNYLTDLDKIIDSIVNIIKDTMKLNRAGVLLVNQKTKPVHYEIAKVIGFNEKNGISLVQDNFLTRYLQKTQKLLVRDELKLISQNTVIETDRSNILKLQAHMEKIEASLCLPLMSNNELIGIVVLGGKESGDAYTNEDLELLSTLSLQAGIAIDNARLYEQAKKFNQTLQQKVDEQTKDLKAKAEHLKKLLEMRSEFLDIASHQLKTPVSVILGTISMFKEGSIQKLPKKQQEKFIDNIFYKAKKLGTIINDILRASEMDTDEFTLVRDNIKPMQISEIADEVYADLLSEAKERGLKLIVKKPKIALPLVQGEHDFFEQALYNLVDNAIKYTSEGSVTISMDHDKNGVVVKVSDTGIGIPKEDEAKIFQKFNRARNAVDRYADGSGLGLFIVKKIVEAHGGTIGFETELNKGTTFSITLPLKKTKASIKKYGKKIRK